MDLNTPTPQTSRWRSFRSQRIVHAFKLSCTKDTPDGLLLVGTQGETQHVSAAWVSRHAPVEGGYVVCYPDRYLSFCPEASFEEGYIINQEPSA